MTQAMTPGAKLRLAVQEERPLQVVGAINAYHARMAERAGAVALPGPVKGLMKMAARVMTTVAHRV